MFWPPVLLPPPFYAYWAHSLSHTKVCIDPKVHNALLCAYSAIVLVGMVLHWSLTQQMPSLCTPTPPLPLWLTTSWYISKFWEWGDTLLLVQRRKPIRRVHFVHHMITPSLVALQFIGRGTWQTPLFEVGTALNAFVHVWMYAYFYNPTAWSPAWRGMITCLQVSQHVIMTALIGTTVLLRDTNCITDVSGNIVPFLVYCMFTVEFTYLLPPRVRDMVAGMSGMGGFFYLALRSSSERIRGLSYAVLAQGITCHLNIPNACTVDLVLNSLYIAVVNAISLSRIVSMCTALAAVAFAYKRHVRLMDRSHLHWVFHSLLVQIPLSVALAQSGL